MEAGNERTALAADLFGRSATELLPILNQGATSIEEMRKQAENYGLVMSDEAVKASDDFGDSVALMQQTLTGMKNRMMGEFLPSLTLVTDGLAKLFTGDMSGLNSINDGIGQFVDKISQAIPQIIKVGGSILQALATAIMENMPLLVTAAFDLISQFAGFVLENIPMLLETALAILTTLALGIAEQAPTLIPAVVSTMLTIMQTLIDNIPMLIDASIQLMIGLAEGLITAIPLLVKEVPNIIVSLVNAITKNAPMLIRAAFDIMIALVNGLIQAIPQLIATVPQMISALVKAFGAVASTVMNIGTNLVKGIFNGISNAVSWLYGKLRGWVSDVLSYIKGLFGIKSPSTVMREEVGKMLAFGLGDGIMKYAGYATNAMKSLMAGVMGETYNPVISASVNGSTGLYGDALASAGGMGGVSIGQVNFNQPLQSTTQAAKLFARKLTGELYA
jgi:phage-related protein